MFRPPRRVGQGKKIWIVARSESPPRKSLVKGERFVRVEDDSEDRRTGAWEEGGSGWCCEQPRERDKQAPRSKQDRALVGMESPFLVVEWRPVSPESRKVRVQVLAEGVRSCDVRDLPSPFFIIFFFLVFS